MHGGGLFIQGEGSIITGKGAVIKNGVGVHYKVRHGVAVGWAECGMEVADRERTFSQIAWIIFC